MAHAQAPLPGIVPPAVGEAEMPDLRVNVPVLELPRGYRLAKRALDVTVASIALVLLAPVMFLIALVIKFDLLGFVFFRQVCIGRDRKSVV